jgi:hypothetical protein
MHEGYRGVLWLTHHKGRRKPSLSYVTPLFMPLQFMTTTINQKTIILRNVKNAFFKRAIIADTSVHQPNHFDTNNVEKKGR